MVQAQERFIGGARASDFRPALIGAIVDPSQLPAPAASCDLRQWCTGTQDQIGSQCVGEGLSNAHWIAVRNQGRRASHRGIYVAARSRERLRKGDALLDVGCDPADAIDALCAVGAYPLDARDDDWSALNESETWPEAVASKLFPVSSFMPIDMGDTDTVDRVLTAGFPVVDWMTVDKAFENYTGTAPWQGLAGAAVGGHCTVIVAKLPSGDYVIWNSWGTSWGQDGFGVVARSVIASNAGLCGVMGGPIL